MCLVYPLPGFGRAAAAFQVPGLNANPFQSKSFVHNELHVSLLVIILTAFTMILYCFIEGYNAYAAYAAFQAQGRGRGRGRGNYITGYPAIGKLHSLILYLLSF